MKTCLWQALFAWNAAQALPFQVPQFRCTVRDRESTAMPENQVTQSAAFGATSEEAFQLIRASCGPSRSSPSRFFLLSFWASFLSRAALALAFFTVSPDRVPRLCQSYKNQGRNGQGTFTGNKWLTARLGSSSHRPGSFGCQHWKPPSCHQGTPETPPLSPAQKSYTNLNPKPSPARQRLHRAWTLPGSTHSTAAAAADEQHPKAPGVHQEHAHTEGRAGQTTARSAVPGTAP